MLFYNKNLSTNEVSVSNVVKLYPNPVSQGESVYVDTEFEKIEVFTLSGQLAKTLEKGKSFSTNGLIKGVYLVKLTAKNGVIKTSKLMVK
ncbi:T9SS type A sorting domain-containing protein [Riemerella anatipestifer]|uniref:T9SS type A sorting domain-containing protein n=1 Tax=Riemerella anatipestifer TaxID=34085 RepID=UPI00285CBF5C|nr:T9SS type A sorting domain-containing protein [Riemerella anatipestifer]MDR7786950.1 T9SS type A sorting domain-containing protein [Riemerella anatipestifer]